MSIKTKDDMEQVTMFAAFAIQGLIGEGRRTPGQHALMVEEAFDIGEKMLEAKQKREAAIPTLREEL